MKGDEKGESVLADLGCRIGRRANELRELQGLSKTKLADNADMDPSSISVFLNGGRPEISVQTLVKIAWGLGVGVEELIDVDGLRESQPATAPSRVTKPSVEARLALLEARYVELQALPAEVRKLSHLGKAEAEQSRADATAALSPRNVAKSKRKPKSS